MRLIREQRQSLMFVSITFLFTWIIWLPLLLNYQFNSSIPTIKGQFLLGSFGPLIGAIVTVWRFDGREGVRSWFGKRFSFNSSKKIIGIVILSLALYLVVGAIVDLIVTRSLVDLKHLGITEKLSGASPFLVLLVWTLTFGLGEETGWRGLLLPNLSKGRNLVQATLLLDVVWISWHIPEFFFNPTYTKMGWGIIGWLITIVLGSFWLTWMVWSGGWSLLPLILWHGGFDFLTGGDSSSKAIAPAVSTIVIIQSVRALHKLRSL